MDLLTELESLIPELEKGLDQASSLQEMEALRVEFLGRKGRIARSQHQRRAVLAATLIATQVNVLPDVFTLTMH